LPVFNISAAIIRPLHRPAQPSTTVYDNTENFLGYVYPNGGATEISGDDITALVADDIQTVGGAGQGVNSFAFSIANLDPSTVTAQPIVSFYAGDGSGGLPGTVLAAYELGPVSVPSGEGRFLQVTGTNLFTIPTNGFFWAGINFDDANGTTGATAANLNNMGQLLCDPPVVGSSQDGFFISDNAGLGPNPAGAFYASPFGGDPVGNYGWQFTVPSSAAPEFGSAGQFALYGLVAITGVARRRRQRTAPQA
jgi:hypothetical protein